MPFAGKGLWVWYPPASPAALAAELRAGGYDWVTFKIHDGDSSWVGRHGLDAAYVGVLRSLWPGAVYGWGYVYCDDKTGDVGDRGEGVPEIEAATATVAVRELRLEAYIIDAEIEWDSASRFNVGRFFDALDNGWDGIVGGPTKVARDYPIAVACWASVAGHEGYPWQIAVQRSDCLMPMVYGGAFNEVRVAEVSAIAQNAGKPVAPIVSLFGDEGERIARAVGGWALGVSAWEWSGVDPAAWWQNWRLPRGVPIAPPPAPLQPAREPDRMAAYRDQLFAGAGDAHNDGLPEAIGVQNLIRWGKGEIELSEQTRRELGIGRP